MTNAVDPHFCDRLVVEGPEKELDAVKRAGSQRSCEHTSKDGYDRVSETPTLKGTGIVSSVAAELESDRCGRLSPDGARELGTRVVLACARNTVPEDRRIGPLSVHDEADVYVTRFGAMGDRRADRQDARTYDQIAVVLPTVAESPQRDREVSPDHAKPLVRGQRHGATLARSQAGGAEERRGFRGSAWLETTSWAQR